MTLGAGIKSTPLPQGFFASGVNCGVRRYRPDVGLIWSDSDLVAAGVFTVNTAKAAPVLYCQSLLPAKNIRAILTNSGQANAGTGPEGVERNLQLANAVAKNLNVKRDQVLVASTGKIGIQLESEKICDSVPELLARGQDVADGFSVAILTTDLVPKSLTTTVQLSQGSVRLTGICKGSGMIHPQMATMIGYILTDAIMTAEQADSMLKGATAKSFNMISVDGDCSTNDSCFLMASGKTGIDLKTSDDVQKFQDAVENVAIELAKAIASDGEGATKLIEVHVRGATSLELARKAARSVVVSPLVKCAVHGEDPNWGRLFSRLGQEMVEREAIEQLNIHLQDECMVKDGIPVQVDREALRGQMRTQKIIFNVDLKIGDQSATAWGCDLSKKYVDINTEYS